MVFYLGVLALGLAGLLSNRVAATVMALGFLLALVLAPHFPLHPRIDRFISLGTPFVLGVWIYVWRESVRLSPWLVGLLVLAATVTRGTPVFEAAFSLALAYTTLALGFARIPMLLTYNRLGDYSYGTYVFAFPIQQLMAHYGATTPALNMMFALPLTLTLAVISWRLVEAPALLHVHSTAHAEAGSA